MRLIKQPLTQLPELLQRRLARYSEGYGNDIFTMECNVNEPQSLRHYMGFTIERDAVLPLHAAICLRDLELIKALVHIGADVNKIAEADNLIHHGKDAISILVFNCPGTPSDIAIKIADFLLEHGANKNKDVDDFFKRYEDFNNRTKYMIRHALSHDARDTLVTAPGGPFLPDEKINEIGHKGIAPIHYAARIGNLKLIKELRGKGVNIFLKDKKGNSALDYATNYGRVEAVELLLSYQPENDIIQHSLEVAHTNQASPLSCLWSSRFWQGCNKKVDYNETTEVLEAAISLDLNGSGKGLR